MYVPSLYIVYLSCTQRRTSTSCEIEATEKQSLMKEREYVFTWLFVWIYAAGRWREILRHQKIIFKFRCVYVKKLEYLALHYHTPPLTDRQIDRFFIISCSILWYCTIPHNVCCLYQSTSFMVTALSFIPRITFVTWMPTMDTDLFLPCHAYYQPFSLFSSPFPPLLLPAISSFLSPLLLFSLLFSSFLFFY